MMGWVGVGELCPVDLALEHLDLVSECEDLCVKGVAGRDEPLDLGGDPRGSCWGTFGVPMR